MDEIKPNGSEDAGRKAKAEISNIEAAGRPEDGEQVNSVEDQTDDADRKADVFVAYVLDGWKKMDFDRRVELGIAGLGLLAVVVYTVFAALQWSEIHYTNWLTSQALNASDKTLSQTLEKMQLQVDATNRLADATKESASISGDNLRITTRDLGAFFQVNTAYVGGFFPPQLQPFTTIARNIGHRTATGVLLQESFRVFDVGDGHETPDNVGTLHWKNDDVIPEDYSQMGRIIRGETEAKRVQPQDVFGEKDPKQLYLTSRNHIVMTNASITYSDGFGNKMTNYGCSIIYTRQMKTGLGQTFSDTCDHLEADLAMRREELKKEIDCKTNMFCAM